MTPDEFQYPEARLLLTYPIVAVLKSEGIDVADLLSDREFQQHLYWFPDGSLLIDDLALWDTFYDRGGNRYRYLAGEIDQASAAPTSPASIMGRMAHCSMLPHPPRSYHIMLWGEHVRKLKGDDIIVVNNRATWGKAEEYPLDDMKVTIWFMRRVTKQFGSALVEAMNKWAASTRLEGVFGEGPVEVESTIQFFTRGAQVRMNFSRSGPMTLLWFLLMLAEYSKVRMMNWIFFTPYALTHVPYERVTSVPVEEMIGHRTFTLTF